LTNRTDYINEARAKYDAYDTDEWIKAGFDEQSGGYCVYHKEHRFDPTKGIFGFERGKYEKFSSKILMKYGMRVELTSEEQGENEEGEKLPDGLLNERKFEIKSIEGTGKENVLKDIKDASKKGAEIVVLYYHKESLFDEMQIRENYNTYLRTSKSKRVQHVYYIVNQKLHKLKNAGNKSPANEVLGSPLSP